MNLVSIGENRIVVFVRLVAKTSKSATFRPVLEVRLG
jgi:hypothetical protein